ncbi:MULTISPECIES: urease accessory protein UreE [Citrobacter freundii complex]|uniref:urease accessory protein UreE n=1 Tax=Citrobacter freundii complex TaxID=1344959 RepID=UPI0018FFF502|nr:urease accessory protein UreE [Citrobacter freundii]EKW1724468.1 urease accessory protein UreE [Citrobacter freundii]ELS0842452.1 urease accessory protein UreE [Citrobacter freundii]MBJ8802192.1 urease accessory protein UreE [Citrobacter freundii]HEI9737597.1 urease accessory protein UreE [Citrobacter freundii]
MYLIEKTLGNINSRGELDLSAEGIKHDVLVLEQWEAQKSRCRKKSQFGYDIGLSLDRHIRLNDGDILLYDKANRYLLTVKIQLRRVMVVDLGLFDVEKITDLLTRAFELGHALGNQHWKAVIKGYCVFIPIVVADKMLASVMKSHGYIEGQYYFTEGEKVIPLLTPSESRLLFGGTEEAHTHVHIDH